MLVRLCAASVLVFVTTAASGQIISFEDCHANTHSYLAAAGALRDEARVLSDEGGRLWADGNSAWPTFFQRAREKVEEASRLTSRGQRERLDCLDRVRAEAAEQQRERERRKAWSEAEKAVDDVKVKYDIGSAMDIAAGFQKLRDAKGNAQAAVTNVTNMTASLRNSVSVSGQLGGTGGLGSIPADMLSLELTETALRGVEASVNDALGAFEEQMERFRRVRMEPEPAGSEQAPATRGRDEWLFPSSDDLPRRQDSSPPAPVHSEAPSRAEVPRRDGVCPPGWLSQHDATGYEFCRCPSTGDEYQDPAFLEDDNICE